MFPGETISTGAAKVCPDCGAEFELPGSLKVLTRGRGQAPSGAGFYLGTYCCQPYSRETDYFATREETEAALAAANLTGIIPKLREL